MADTCDTHELSNNDLLYGSITPDDVQTIIDRAVQSNAKIVSYHVKSYAEERVGFLGAHSILDITIQRVKSSIDEIHSFFVKCLPHGSKEELLINEFRVFQTETTFFRHIVPELTRNFESQPWSAQCYLVKDDALVFENLQLRNFRMTDLEFDDITLKAVIASLARFHAASVVAEKRIGKPFLELHPAIFEETLFNRKGIFYKWFLTGIDVVIGLAESLGLENSGKVTDYLQRIFEISKPSKTRRNIVCHGDLWPNNVMVDDGSPPACMLVDYQTLRYLPQAADIAHVVYMTTNRRYRDASEKHIVGHYHEVFCETVLRNDPDVKLSSLEELLEEYEEYRCYGVAIAAFCKPQVLMDKDYRTELTKDSAAYERFFFEERTGLVLELMDKDPIYRERIVEVVRETVERSNKSS